MKEFVLPELGENISAAVVIRVMVKSGDVIKEDQPLLEIETDKATIEVPSSVAGTVKTVAIKDGDTVKVGAPVFTYEDGVAAPAPVASPAPPPPPVQVAAPVATPAKAMVSTEVQKFVLPELGENIAKATVIRLMVEAGKPIKEDQAVLEIETDKATIEVPSSVSGMVVEVFIKEGDSVPVGNPVFSYLGEVLVAATTTTAPVAQAVTATPAPAPAVQASASVASTPAPIVEKVAPPKGVPAPAAPSVRRLARELGIDINVVPGSGPRGRISIEDVKGFVKALNLGRASLPSHSSSAAPAIGHSHVPLPDFSKFGAIEKQPMSTIRYKTAEHLSNAWATIPHVTQFDKADITELEKMRKVLAPSVQAKGGKLTMTAILAKVIAQGLKQFPQFNAAVDMLNKELVFKKYYNVGIAVDTDRGLIVPVLRDVDKKGLTQIAVDLNTISQKARDRKVSPADLEGGCFTISNLGGIGGTYFTPIVNSPEVAILGVSKGGFEPVYNNGAFEPRLMLPLSLSYDHRIIDGADAIRFLRYVIDNLEQPLRLLLD